MPSYQAPLQDMDFAYRHLGNAELLAACPDFDETTPELVSAVLEEAGKFAAEVLQPLNRSGDEEGCRLEEGEVLTPDGFKEAYRDFVANGWGTLSCETEFGGQALPHTVGWLVEEMFSAANMSFSMYPGLTMGAYSAVSAHADADLKHRYLPKLATGEWSGTMCLTEPHCGTDLGLIRTRAEPFDDGSYRITGSKIFISAGEHDLSENIVHLMLAKLPDSPDGTRGISLFLVPKYLTDDGGADVRNAVSCTAVEHKMGIRASATCSLSFDDAVGYLVGEPNRGMHAMFTMMNAARLGVGVQGLSVAEAAYQGAVAYAKERLQGRALKGPRYPELAADPIIVHPDIKRTLLTMRAYVEGGRALAVWVGAMLDVSRHHPDADAREEADDLVALLTPVIKAFLTDVGSEVTNLGVQVFGGHGYIREHGMEQLVRDARIAQIYEGTNGIQALDLIGRKLPHHTGRLLRRFFHPVDAFLSDFSEDEAMRPYVAPLAKAFGRLQRATAQIAQSGMNDPDDGAAVATEYLRLFALVATGFMWAKSAAAVLSTEELLDSDFGKAKLRTGRFFMDKILAQSSSLFAQIMSGAEAVVEFDEEAF